jgi:hypothetical protein
VETGAVGQRDTAVGADRTRVVVESSGAFDFQQVGPVNDITRFNADAAAIGTIR